MENSQKKIKSENGIISVNSPLNVTNMKCLGSTLFEKMTARKKEVAKIEAVTGQKVTWDYILQLSVRTAISMRSRGVTSDHIITVCSGNLVDCCSAVLASWFLGAKVANLSSRLSVSDAVHILKQIRPKMVFVDCDDVKFIENVIRDAGIETRIIVYGPTLKHYSFCGFALPSADEKTFTPVEVKDVKETALIVFTNDDSDLPKGVCLSHEVLLAPKLGQMKNLFGKVYLSLASFYCVSAISVLLLNVLQGLIDAVIDTFDKEYIWCLITSNEVNILSLTPYQAIVLSKNGKPEKSSVPVTLINTASLTHVIIEGGPISKEQMLEIQQVFAGALVVNRYAKIELADNGLEWTFEEEDFLLLQKKSQSVGRPICGAQYKVVNPETEERLGPYQKGELRIKSEFQMNGYYNFDSTGAWDSDGFFKTGDMFYYDEDYCFYIVGKISDIFKYQLELVVPSKIEAVLLSHPAVEAAVVFGIPHAKDGNHPMGLVVLKDTCSGVTVEELQDFLNGKVDDHEKLRAGVKIVKYIPLDPNDKYNRRQLKDMALLKEF